MNNLIQNMQTRYLDDHAFLGALGRENICVLSNFLSHRQVMEDFWRRFYPEELPRRVICGLNPGRFGAGLTGVPFTDFQTLSRWMPSVEGQDTEPSAQFFAKIVDAIGVDSFFQRFYVTNVSAVGYVKDGRNLNYHDLPADALEVVEQNFTEEMRLVAPTRVVALGKHAYATVKKTLPSDIDITYLAHPSWIMTYRRRELDAWVQRYVGALLS